MKKISLLALLIVVGFTVSAQMDGIPYNPETTTLGDSDIRFVKRAITILREFRFQAYIQPEWQKADTAGAQSYAGGNFPPGGNNRFLLRRGRFKFSFEHVSKKDLKIMEFAFQFDATEKGFTAVKDFYGRIIDPWIGWFSLQGGIFLRPFGFESPAPPAFYESPEFSRMNQTIMPNECELGEAIVIESPAKFEKFYARLDANLVNGEGIGVGAQTGAYQSKKDFIGRIKMGKVWELGKVKLGLNGSASIYEGFVLQPTNDVYALADTIYNGKKMLYYNDIGKASNVGKLNFKREYYGAHLEFKADYGIGITTLRAEFIGGMQPGSVGSSSVPLGSGNNAPPPNGSLYLRQFNGAMFFFTQSFRNKLKDHTMMHDITLKYDYYAPLARVSGMNLDPNLGFTPTDVKFYDIGIGYSFVPYNWFKLMVWYDIVKNENTILPAFNPQVPIFLNTKNNVLTIRTQFYIDTWWFNPKSKYKDNLMLKKY
jgi:hypothetical protein